MRSLVLISILLIFSVSTVQAAKKKASSKQDAKVHIQQFGNWFYRCVTPKKSRKAENCEVVQIAQAKQGKKVINLLTISISEIVVKKKKEPVITIIAPLDVYLPKGFGLQIDKEKVITLRYRNCNKSGCWIQALLTSEIVKSLNNGKNGFGRIRLLNGKNVNIKFSLNGLTKAYQAMKKKDLPKGKKSS
ncbi:MAG: invasion associated locus B family protein [Methyloligellaceae bacterium]